MSNLSSYGIAHLGIIPMRSQPSDKSELCNQLLFGETYQVLEEEETKKWLYIKNDYDNYEGWMAANQFRAISQAFYDKCQQEIPTFFTGLATVLRLSLKYGPIVKGAKLPFYEPVTPQPRGTLQMESKLGEISGAVFSPESPQDYDFLFRQALDYLGTPYLWGGKSPFGIDCSGFTQQVFRMAGYHLFRDAYQQAEQGALVPNLAQAQPGDLAFFERNQKIIHVGIITAPITFEHQYPTSSSEKQALLPPGNHPIMHAYDCVRIDRLDEEGIYNIDKQVYTHKLKKIRRVLKKPSMKSQ